MIEPRYEARDPDYQRRMRERFDRQGMMGHLGAALAGLGPG